MTKIHGYFDDEDRDNRYYKLTENVTYGDIVVKAGFETDGASIPRPLWPLINHPFAKKIIYGAVIHDYLYNTHLKPRKESDKIFIAILKDRGVPATRRFLIYWGLRIGGKKAWNTYGEKIAFQ